MANRNLQVNLSFKADTSAALKNLETLRSSLNSISSMPFQGGKVITQEIRQAASAAQQLQHHLGMAMDVKTGNLNLNKLQASLQQSNTTLSSLTGNLLKAGATGQQAFLATHRAISNANLQLTKSNTLISQFTSTLFSAAKWQAAYGAINMVTQGLGNAVDYAKELDKSLNNIRIVTGYSADKMATFAKQANEAAKALNTTTTKYTDASLIYFQQGLGDAEVKERTDITVKLANVVGESAEQVSEWTTAIWNNFAKGGEALESYADKLAALGAATASSADEIAQGLEKFSAVADTVGLSFDYATAALATVTAETRQSADVVGTAFKTLFARMEGLKLGETLDDGTTLNQYSNALLSVGINIKNANGDLKNMDTILEEMGIRWETLSKDQQVALAQSVGGIRQYNQLISLMDNWDKFQTNLQTAQNAEGTLGKQAAIYADSWEAAQNEIKTSAEEMYNILLPSDAIIDFTSGAAKLLDLLNEFLEATGGLKTILLGVVSLVLTKFQPTIASTLDNLISKLYTIPSAVKNVFKSFGKISLSAGDKKWNNSLQNQTDIQRQTLQSTEDALNTAGISESFKTELTYQREIERHSINLANVSKLMTESEQKRLSLQIQELEMSQKRSVELLKQKEILEDQFSLMISEPMGSGLVRPDIEENIEWNDTGEIEGVRVTNPIALGRSDGENVQSFLSELLKEGNSSVTLENERQNIDAQLDEISASETKLNERLFSLPETNILEEIESLQALRKEAAEVQTQYSGQTKSESYKNATVLGQEALSKIQALLPNLENASIENVDSYLSQTGAEKSNLTEQLNQVSSKREELQGKANAIPQTGYTSAVFQGTDDDTYEGAIKSWGDNYLELNKVHIELEQMLLDLNSALEPIDREIQQIDEEVKNLGDSEEDQTKLKELEERKADLNRKKETMIQKTPENLEEKIKDSKLTTSQKTALIEATKEKDIKKAITVEMQKQEKISKNAGKSLGVSNKGWLKIKASVTDIISKLRDSTSSTKELASKTQLIRNGFAAAKNQVSSVGNTITSLTSSLSSGLMAVNMLKSGFEQLSEEGVSIANLSSVFMGLSMAAPIALKAINTVTSGLEKLFVANKVNKAMQDEAVASTISKAAADYMAADATDEETRSNKLNVIATALGITTDEAAIVAEKLNAVTKGQETKEIDKNTRSVILNALSWNSHPLMWIVTIIIAVIAAIALLAISLQENTKQTNENAKAAYEQAKQNQELIDKNQELSEKIGELTEEYYALDRAGESTYETFEKIKEQLPALIESYEDLADKGMFSAESLLKLKEAAKIAELTGNIDGLTSARAVADKEIRQNEIEQNKMAYESAGAAISSTQDGQGSASRLNYSASYSADAQRYLAEVFKDSPLYNNGSLSFERGNEEDAIEYYEGLQKTAAMMAAAGDITGDGYAEIQKELAAMTESYDTLKASREKLIEDWKLEFQDEVSSGVYDEAISSLQTYEFQRANIIKKIQEKHPELSEEEALSRIMLSDEKIAQQEMAYNKLWAMYDKATNYGRNQGANEFEKNLFEFYDSLSEEDRTLFLILDVDKQQSKEQLAESLEELRNTQEIAKIRSSYENEEDLSLHDTYVEVLAEENKLLEENESLTHKAAQQHIRINKGIKDLVDSWEENIKALSQSSKGSVEYAKALNSLQKNVEKIFGYKPSVNAIEDNLKDLEALVNGDAEAFDRLQHAMAQDYVKELGIGEALITEANQVAQSEYDIRNALNNMLANFDTSIEVGKGSTLSGDYLETLEQALKTRQITKDQLDKMAEIKGFEIDWGEISYQNVEGAKTKTVQRFYRDGEINPYKTETMESVEQLQIPILNGKELKVNKTADNSSISKSIYTEKSKEKENAKLKQEDEIERYHEINKSIESVERQLDKLSKAKDRAWGPDKLAYMEAEKKTLEEELELQKQLEKEVEDYLIKDQQKIAGWGAAFDENGNISNYEEMMKHYIDQYNLNPTDETVKEQYEQFKADMEQYEETLAKFEEQQQAVIDKQNEIKDLALEKIEYQVEFKIEMDESELEILDYFIDRAGENWDKAADKIEKLGKKTEIYADQVKLYENAIKDTFAESSYNPDELFAAAANPEELAKLLEAGTLDENQVQMLRDYQSALLELNQSFDEMVETINSSMVSALENANEEFDESLTRLDRLKTMTESYNNIIDIIGKDALGISNKALQEMSKAQLNNANAALETAKAQLDFNQQAYDNVKELYDKDPEMFKDAMKAAEEQLAESQEEFMSRWETALTAAADAFKQNVEFIAEEFEKSVSGIYGTLENMQTAFDRQKEIGELYFQNYKKVYEVSKLNRQIAQSLEKTDNAKAQRELNALMAELNEYNKEGVQMSEYDLGYLQKKYELLQAQIALEEAQNAKNQMTLQRDAEGNWGYVYTADQSNIESAKQSYEDAVYEMQDYKYQSEMALQEQYLEYITQYKEGLLELEEEYGTDSEEYARKAQELAEHYSTLTGYTLEELDEFVTRGGELYQRFGIETVQTYGETILGAMNSAYNNFAEMQIKVDGEIKRTANEIILKHEELSEAIDDQMGIAETSVEDFGKAYEEAAKTVNEKSKEIKQNITGENGIATKVTDAFQEMTNKVNGWYDAYGSRIGEFRTNTESLVLGIQSILDAYDALAEAAGRDYSPSRDYASELQQQYDNLNEGGTASTNLKATTDPWSIFDRNKLTTINSGFANTEDLAIGTTGSGMTISDASNISVTTGNKGNYFVGSETFTDAAWIEYQTRRQEEQNSGNNSYNTQDYLREKGLGSLMTDDTKRGQTIISELQLGSNSDPQEKTDFVNFTTNKKGGISSYPGYTYDLKDGTLVRNTDTSFRIDNGASGSIMYIGSHKAYMENGGQQSGQEYYAIIWTGSNNTHMRITDKATIKNILGRTANSEELLKQLETIPKVSVLNFYNTDNKIVGGANKDKDLVTSTQMRQMYFGFDTGGYTGEWGPEGRLAMLHQKEIVLNATDTENLLRTIDMVRSFNDRIEQSARLAALGLSNFGGIASRPYGGDTLQQEVTIHAEFPNVTDHNEVELALNNLINDASQYANRKN